MRAAQRVERHSQTLCYCPDWAAAPALPPSKGVGLHLTTTAALLGARGGAPASTPRPLLSVAGQRQRFRILHNSCPSTCVLCRLQPETSFCQRMFLSTRDNDSPRWTCSQRSQRGLKSCLCSPAHAACSFTVPEYNLPFYLTLGAERCVLSVAHHVPATSIEPRPLFNFRALDHLC